MKRIISLCLVTLLCVFSGASSALAATVTETFDSYANGTVITNIGGGGVWTIGTNAVISSGGVNGSAGLGVASQIFNWKGQPFQWSTLAIGTKVAMSLDFQSSPTGKFDDDRVGWTIDADNSGSTTHQLALQLDNTSEGGMVVYWNSTRTLLNALSGIKNSTWYRFNVEYTKLGATNAAIVGTLTELNASGNPTGTPYIGTITNTATFANKPEAARFTSAFQWPSFKNYNAAVGNADNASFTLPPPYRSYTGAPITENFDGLGTSGTNVAVLTGWNVGHFNPAIQQGTAGGSGTSIVPDPLVADNGSHDPNTTPMLANFGTTGAADRALGSFARTTPAGDQFLQLAIKNDSANPITSFVLTYTGEEWRNCDATVQQLTVWYSGTSPTNGFVSMGPDFAFSSPNNTGANVALDGNAATNRTVISATYTPATPIAPGSTFYLRWYDINDNSIADDYLAIDDLTVTPASDATVAITSPANGSTVIGDWVAIAATGTPSGGASVTNVEFYAGAMKIGEDATAPYTMNWCEVPPATYSLTAVVLDDSGASATSSVVSVTLSAPAADGSLQFDGSDDYVTFGAAPELGLSTFTIECWFKRTGVGKATTTGNGGVTNAVPLVTKGRGEAEGSNLDMNWFLGISTNGNVLAADFEEGAAGASPGLNHPVFGSTPLANDVWHHAAATYDGATWTLYLNGNVEASLAVGQPPRSDSIQHAALASALTSTGVAAGYLQGLLDEVRVWNYARSATEIADSYALQITNQTGLVARWALNEGAGLVVRSAVCGGVNGDLKNGPAWSSGSFLAPSVSITSPANNAVLYGKTIAIGATASDTDGSVTNVQFFSGNTLLGEDATEPYGFVWTGVTPGAYALKAVATDNDGLSTTSAVVNVTMTLVAPAVSITSPANNATISDTTVTIEATASDTDGSVTNVQFYSGNTLLGEDATEPYGFVWNSVAPGAYVLKAVATDDDGLSKTSAVVNVTVTPPPGLGGLYFDGQSNYVTFGAAPALGVTNFTIECWFKRQGAGKVAYTGSSGTYGVPLVTRGRSQNDSPANLNCNYFFGISTNTGGLTADFEDKSGGGNHPITSTHSVGSNVWQHAAVTYSVSGTNGTWRLYTNGVLDATLILTNTNPLVLTPEGDSIQHAALGSALDSNGSPTAYTPAGFFQGTMDEVRIWAYARSADDIFTNYDRQITTSEPGLIARWSLDDALGTTATNDVTGGVNGTLLNGPVWVDGYPFPAGPANQAPAAPALVAPANGATNLSLAPSLSVTVSDPETNELTVTFYGRVASTEPAGEDFVLVALPDTQNYSASLSGGSPAIFTNQTQWILNNRVARNIAYVAHLGDVVNNGDTSGQEFQWQAATNAMYRLGDALLTGLPDGIPHGIAVGNHDQTPIYDPAGTTTYFNQFFGANYFQWRSYYGGQYGTNNDNHYDLFRAGGMDFIVIYLEYDASMTNTSPALVWADNLLQAHSSRRAIVVSHSIVNTGFNATFSAQGQAIYNGLKDNTNLCLMLCGHVSGEGQRTDTYQGRAVWSILTDYQGRTAGGNGWLRFYEFSPASNVIHAKTYSPWLDQWETDADSQFDIPCALSPANPFTVIGSLTNVPSGSEASIVWTNLVSGTSYEWFAVASDGSRSATGATNRFATEGVAPQPVTVTLSLTGSPLAEAAGEATVTATLSQTNADVVTVNLAFAGTATPTADYTCSGASISIPAGELTGSITLTAVQDALYESPDETIVVDIDSVANASEDGNQRVTATIADDDPAPPSVSLSLTGSPMAEAAGEATVTATLSTASASAVTVNLAFSGTATLTADYTRSGASISIPAGELTGSITLTAVQDTVYESPAETIVVDISTVDNGIESGTQQVTATITDNLATAEFTAYNDCSKGDGVNPANTTEYPGNGSYSGLLKDFNTGAALPVTLTLITNLITYDGSGGPMPNAGTDAYDTFNGKVVFDNVIWYTAASNGFWMDAIFTGLDPAKEYEFATSVNRGGSGSDYGSRFSKFTISDVDSATQSSTPGVTVNSATSVTFCSGSNTVNGYVARWTAIRCGADGSFTVRVQDGGGVGKGYAFDGIMLRESVPHPETIIVTADSGQSKVFGAADPAFTYVCSDTNVTFTGALGRAAGEDVGSYAINQGDLSAGTNYTITFVPANFAITAKPITVTADSGQSKVFGASDPVLTYLSSDLGASFTGALGRASGEDVGSYAINQGDLSAGANYAITFVPANFAITAKPITVTADSGQSKVFGASDPVLSYVSSDLGASFTGALGRASGEDVGSYAINQGDLSAGANYAITFVPANFAITPASSATAISSSLNPSTAGSNVTFTVTVSAVAPATATPTGSVQFLTNDVAFGSPASLTDGTATLDTALLPPGTNTLTASYLGDANYLGSTNSLLQVVTVVVETPSVLGIVPSGDGSVTVTFAGTPGAEYLVLGTTDLVAPGSWVSVSTNTAGPEGQWTYTDNTVTNHTQRFFRAAKP